MFRFSAVVIVLRSFLVALFGFLVVLEIFSLPGMFAHRAAESAPEYAHVSWILLAATELAALSLQVVLVCTWRLLTLVQRDRIFSPSSFRWVDAIAWALTAAWVGLLALAAYLSAFIFFTPELRDPGVPVLLFGTVLVSGVVVLLVLVLRALLRQATVLRSDMEAVI
jgi:hypothetical protein